MDWWAIREILDRLDRYKMGEMGLKRFGIRSVVNVGQMRVVRCPREDSIHSRLIKYLILRQEILPYLVKLLLLDPQLVSGANIVHMFFRLILSECYSMVQFVSQPAEVQKYSVLPCDKLICEEQIIGTQDHLLEIS